MRHHTSREFERSLNPYFERSLKKVVAALAPPRRAPYIESMNRPPSPKRQQALSRAMNLFWRKGFHATSLKDLEGALDMRPGSIYAAFGSKEALFRLALDRYGAEMGAQTARIFDAAPTPLAGLAAYLRSLGGLRDSDAPSYACMLMKTVLELPPGDDPARAAAEALLARAEAGFAKQFAAARDLGELAAIADPARLGRRLQINVMGLKAYAQRGADSADLRAAAEDMAREVEALARSVTS